MSIDSNLFKSFMLSFLFVLSISPVAAHEQPPIENQFKEMSPKKLIGYWKNASRADRGKIEEALLENRSLSLPGLREAVSSGSSQEKMLAADFLVEMRDKESIDVLLAATINPDERVQVRMIIALRDIGDSRALVRMRELVRTTQGGPVLKSSLVALGRLGSSSDLALIRSWLSHGDESVRVNAAAALAMLGSSEGQEILLRSTNSEDLLPRVEAIVALGYLRTTEARSRLEEIINDPEGHWKSEALVASAQQRLATISAQEKVEHLGMLAYGFNRYVASWAVDQLSDLDTPEVVDLLRGLASRGGKIGEKAHRRLRSREAR